MAVYKDQLGAEISLDRFPQRIVSLVPSQTELLYDLGLEEQVVGITKFCVHPEEWFRSKTRIGGTKNIHIDRIAALQPDLVIANKEENVEEQVKALEAIAPVWTSDIVTLPDAVDMIRSIGAITGKEAAAHAIIAQLEKELVAAFTFQPVFRTAYLIWKDPWMTVGGDTFIHDMLHRAGFINVFAERKRYPVITPGEIRDHDVQVLLLSSEPYPFRSQHLEELRAALPGVSIHLADGEMFSWYGSRLLHSAGYFQQLRAEVIRGMQP